MSSNPLQQYFRRPVIYFSLPSQGKFYSEDVVDIPPNKELPVYPMTTLDEISARTPDALYNGTALVDIIKSCIPNIKNPWMLNSIDLDAVTVAIKIASTGEEMDINSTCPACAEETSYGINLVTMLQRQNTVNYDEVLQIGPLKIKFKPLTFTEINNINISQYEIRKILTMLSEYDESDEQKRQIKENFIKMNNIINDMISDTISEIITPDTTVTDHEYILEFLSQCDKKTNTAIKDASIALKEQNSIKPIDIKCVKCQHDYKQSIVINIVDFFD